MTHAEISRLGGLATTKLPIHTEISRLGGLSARIPYDLAEDIPKNGRKDIGKCLVIVNHKTNNGRIDVNRDGRRWANVGRYVYELVHKKELRPEEVVHHECNNPLCINPFHLTLLSKSDHDRIRKIKEVLQIA